MKSPDNDAIKVLIVDDHKMIRDGLKVMLGSFKEFPFKVMEAESGEKAMIKLAGHDFEIVIIDYQMPGLSGAETIYRILRFKPQMKILALSNYDELAYIQSMKDAGAMGYVLKNIEPFEMLNAIKTVLNGKPYHSNDVAIKLLDASEGKGPDQKGKKVLTSRETEVLKMIAMEMTNEEIAKELFVSKRTIDFHRQNLTIKLHAKNAIGLLKAAWRLNLLEK